MADKIKKELENSNNIKIEPIGKLSYDGLDPCVFIPNRNGLKTVGFEGNIYSQEQFDMFKVERNEYLEKGETLCHQLDTVMLENFFLEKDVERLNRINENYEMKTHRLKNALKDYKLIADTLKAEADELRWERTSKQIVCNQLLLECKSLKEEVERLNTKLKRAESNYQKDVVEPTIKNNQYREALDSARFEIHCCYQRFCRKTNDYSERITNAMWAITKTLGDEFPKSEPTEK